MIPNVSIEFERLEDWEARRRWRRGDPSVAPQPAPRAELKARTNRTKSPLTETDLLKKIEIKRLRDQYIRDQLQLQTGKGSSK
jgi:hypothetical protein